MKRTRTTQQPSYSIYVDLDLFTKISSYAEQNKLTIIQAFLSALNEFFIAEELKKDIDTPIEDKKESIANES